jgi:hypothetical protein
MIEIEITDSPDSEIIGVFKYNFDKIFLGHSNKNNIVIDDPGIEKFHMVIEISLNQISCRSLSASYFYFEGKKLSGEKNLAPNTIIRIGETSFKILSFLKNPIEEDQEKENEFEEKYSIINESSPEIIDILEQLENELKFIELDKHAGN